MFLASFAIVAPQSDQITDSFGPTGRPPNRRGIESRRHSNQRGRDNGSIDR